MTRLSDLLQVALSQTGWVGFFCCVAVFVFFWLLSRYSKAVFDALKKPFIPFKWNSLFTILCGTLIVWIFKTSISDGLQWTEQRYLNPTYIVADTSSFAQQVYETELSRYVNEQEFQKIKKRTAEIAQKTGSTVLAIYQVAYSECRMNPFVIREDGIAAGWIQFTTIGLTGMGVSLKEVKAACLRRDVDFMMDLTERYLVDRSKDTPLPRAVDVYTCVFAPGFINYPDESTLYSTSDGAAYYLNSIFDGYYTEFQQGKEVILHTRKAQDGRITKRELQLHLEMQKSLLLKNFKN